MKITYRLLTRPRGHRLPSPPALCPSPTSPKVGYRADDHGNSAAAATALPGPGAAIAGSIERTGDIDWFTFDAAAGAASLTLALTPAYGSQGRSNADVQVQVLPACSYIPVASWDPAAGLFNGSQSVTLPDEGTYYVTVQGVSQVRAWLAGRRAGTPLHALVFG